MNYRYEVLRLLETLKSLVDLRKVAAVMRKGITSQWLRYAKPFTFYPSCLMVSDIPVQGLIAAYRPAEKQGQVASQWDVPTTAMAQVRTI